jgi:hypothetical protein
MPVLENNLIGQNISSIRHIVLKLYQDQFKFFDLKSTQFHAFAVCRLGLFYCLYGLFKLRDSSHLCRVNKTSCSMRQMIQLLIRLRLIRLMRHLRLFMQSFTHFRLRGLKLLM